MRIEIIPIKVVYNRATSKWFAVDQSGKTHAMKQDGSYSEGAEFCTGFDILPGEEGEDDTSIVSSIYSMEGLQKAAVAVKIQRELDAMSL